MIQVTTPDGGAVDLNNRKDVTANNWQEIKTIAVQKVDSLYKLVVEQTTVLEEDNVLTDVIYLIYDISDAGVFDRVSRVRRTAAELNEIEPAGPRASRAARSSEPGRPGTI